MNKQIIISPSILSANFLQLQNEIEKFSDAENIWFHLDVMDSHFVPNLTFGKTILKDLHKVTKHKLDAHFMVSNPDFFIENFKDIGIHNFTFHLESVNQPTQTIKAIKKEYDSCGISIKPGTQVTSLTPEILSAVDLILIMSVEPGFGGQSFMIDVLEKVKHLTKLKNDNNYSYEIQIDGGINQSTSKEAIKSGCTNLVAGSYIFKSDNYLKAINSLR